MDFAAIIDGVESFAAYVGELASVIGRCTTIARACFRSLKDAWADTTTPHGRLMLTVLGGLAEFERELIRARTGDGRERAATPPRSRAPR
jgi:hypothetical protein